MSQSRAPLCWFAAPAVTSAPEPDPSPDGDQIVAAVEPADWVKPVELIELLQRRTEKRKQPKAPTSSPFYDAEFVASHRRRRKRPAD
jgi:hypothetical protein